MADGLDEQARAWIVRLNSARATEDDLAAHRLWCAASPAHARAWERASRAWALLGQLDGSAAEVDADVAGRAPRRRKLPVLAVSAALLAACWGGAWLYRPIPLTGLLADAATVPGERRELVLADGSRVAMAGATVLDWKLGPRTREAELVEGEALFEVAHDAARPFTVRAGDARIRVTGTRFSVRRLRDTTLMMLAEGSVEASAGGGSDHLAIRPGQSVRWSASGGAMQVEPVAIDDVGAWGRGRIIVRSRPLGDVLDELGLYRHGRIFALGDVGALRVTGVFDADRPDRALAALAQSLPIRIDRFGPVVLVRRAE